jgi:hypothetical protein
VGINANQHDEQGENPATELIGVGCFIFVPGLLVLAFGALLSGGFFVPQEQANTFQFWGKLITLEGFLLIVIGVALGFRKRR